MLFFRWVILLLLVAGALSLATYVWTGEARWRNLGIRIIKWTVIAALGFFAVLVIERVATIV